MQAIGQILRTLSEIGAQATNELSDLRSNSFCSCANCIRTTYHTNDKYCKNVFIICNNDCPSLPLARRRLELGHLVFPCSRLPAPVGSHSSFFTTKTEWSQFVNTRILSNVA